jgi:hypothetical protein
MGAIWYRASSELRRRWASTLVLALLAGVTGKIVLASVAGARRTSTAMDLEVIGRWAWQLVADSLGTPAAPVVPVLVVVLVTPLTLLVAGVVAAGPARSAATTEPALVLRSE